MAASTIVQGVRIDGKISGTADLKLEGDAHGEIALDGSSVYITKGGKAGSKISAANIFIAGEFNGDAQAVDLVQIAATGEVTGHIKTPSLTIEKGARFTGSIDMGNAPAAATTTPPAARPAAAATAQIVKSEPAPIVAQPASSQPKSPFAAATIISVAPPTSSITASATAAPEEEA